MKKEALDWPRIIHLLKVGILASVMVLTGDMLLGWGVSDPSVTGIPAMFTKYLSVSDGRIIASVLLGLIGIPIECLCWFAVYRMILMRLTGDHALTNALATGWISIGNLWMLGGLLIEAKKVAG